MITKICKNCKKELELQLFNRHPLTKDGYLGHCKECDYIKSDNQARDDLHPGRNSAKQMAFLIYENLFLKE